MNETFHVDVHLLKMFKVSDIVLRSFVLGKYKSSKLRGPTEKRNNPRLRNKQVYEV